VRVKISYGANIEEVPEEINQLFTYVSEKSRRVMRSVELMETLLEEEDLPGAQPIAERIRMDLSDIDSRMVDIQNITSGYIAYKANEGVQDVSEGRPDMVAAGDSATAPTTEQPTSHKDSE
jgi:hypothetical protein